jgi:hypothetical protein
MQAHLIIDGIVVNTIDVPFVEFVHGLVEAKEGEEVIGWSYVNGQFIDNRNLTQEQL